MSDLGTYSFLPWARQGLANRITAPAAGQRAAIDVQVAVEAQGKGGGTVSQTVERSVSLYGPGDVTGIDRSAISRVEPEDWVSNFEPNYFPCIEFYSEDFPWRYSPEAPAGKRLRPWLVLVVLEEGAEFAERRSVETRPLGLVEVTAPFESVFPRPQDAWAWAHVHVNSALTASTIDNDGTAVSSAMSAQLQAHPDLGCSRLICPRKLKPKTGYHAFLMPAFESGRLAGLGLDPDAVFAEPANGLTAVSAAWSAYATPANRPESSYFPYYHRWFFRTAEQGDFETLVRALVPQPVDPRVGQRDMDVTDPAPHIEGIDDAELGGILRLGGALRSPLANLNQAELDEHNTYETWDEPRPHEFQRDLAAFLNLADGYQETGASANAGSGLPAYVAGDPNPLVTPPAYGRWHALAERVLTERNGDLQPNIGNWFHDINLDPRWRVSAGFGTEVIQQNQETYMEGAWDQIGDVLEANRRIRFAQSALHAARQLHRRHLAPLAKASDAGVVLMAAPVAGRILNGEVTLRHGLAESHAGRAMASVAMRRALRPGGRLVRKATGLAAAAVARTRPLAQVLARANDAEITASPPKAPLENTVTPEDLWLGVPSPTPEPVKPSPLVALYDALQDRLFRNPRPLAWLAVILLLLLFLALGPFSGLLALILLIALYVAMRGGGPKDGEDAPLPDTVEEGFTPKAVDLLPQNPDFILVEEASALDPGTAAGLPSEPGVTPSDNGVARAFKNALAEQYRLIGLGRDLGVMPEPVKLDLKLAAANIPVALNPEVTLPRWILSGIELPARVVEQTGNGFVEAMAYPEFDYPMYEPLVDAGVDKFVPNLHLVPPNSVTLLETNQRFIEAYMVGLNHEFARELLWREYPTDQRGSYFRQFWDVRKKLAQSSDPEAAREALKDIEPIHKWKADSDLGSHDQREQGGKPEEDLVLVIRGELLKKYPNTVISAQQARWQTKSDGSPDKAKERELDPDHDPIFPIYEARVAPDLYFFGFDLKAEVARGDDDVDDKPGWFFRIEEVPGDARFGFDVEREAGSAINVWNDLSWADVQPGFAHGDIFDVSKIPSIPLVQPTHPSLAEKVPQWEQDRHVPFGPGISAAELAYVALQTPVLMAVHAIELLPEPGG